MTTDKNGHSNCLYGLACPQCGFADYLNVEVRTILELHDSGTDGFNDTHWDENSFCACPECNYEGTVARFRIEE